MFCQYQYYRWNTEKLQTMVAHSDGTNYHCSKVSDCNYTGTSLINKRPWGDCPAGETGESEEIISEEPVPQEMEGNVEMARSDSEEDRRDRSECCEVRN